MKKAGYQFGTGFRLLVIAAAAIFAQSSSFAEIIHTTAKLSEARNRIAATTVGNKAMFAGGQYADGTSSSVVDIYDFQTGSWSTANLIARLFCFKKPHSRLKV